MKRLSALFCTAVCLLLGTAGLKAQTADSTIFRGYLHNKEYDIYMRLNFYEQDVVISWQDILGPLPGFLSRSNSSYCWIITEVRFDGQKAKLTMVNDSGSDDLVATLTQQNDSTFLFHRVQGATMKMPSKGNWQKLPSSMTFIRRKSAK